MVSRDVPIAIRQHQRDNTIIKLTLDRSFLRRFPRLVVQSSLHLEAIVVTLVEEPSRIFGGNHDNSMETHYKWNTFLFSSAIPFPGPGSS